MIDAQTTHTYLVRVVFSLLLGTKTLLLHTQLIIRHDDPH